MNTHIPTLLLREWMQHKRGWLIAAFAPPILFLALLPFSHMDGRPDGTLEMMALAILVISSCAIYAIALLVALFQLPGLARRDVQDRSIEFWLSLPGRPSESVASTVLAHAWLAPVGAAVVGAAFGLPIALSLLGMKFGWADTMTLHWGEVVMGALPLLLRGLVGTVLLTLWLLPLIFVLMAASAWLKRLGVPVVLVGGGVAVAVMHNVYGIDWPLNALLDLNQHINHALLYSGHGLVSELQSGLNLGGYLLQDLGQSAAELLSLSFVGWMAVAAAGFALVVAKRARGG
jgi:ABC-2 type transport system permease protein